MQIGLEQCLDPCIPITRYPSAHHASPDKAYFYVMRVNIHLIHAIIFRVFRPWVCEQPRDGSAVSA